MGRAGRKASASKKIAGLVSKNGGCLTLMQAAEYGKLGYDDITGLSEAYRLVGQGQGLVLGRRA